MSCDTGCRPVAENRSQRVPCRGKNPSEVEASSLTPPHAGHATFQGSVRRATGIPKVHLEEGRMWGRSADRCRGRDQSKLPSKHRGPRQVAGGRPRRHGRDRLCYVTCRALSVAPGKVSPSKRIVPRAPRTRLRHRAAVDAVYMNIFMRVSHSLCGV